MEEDDDAKLNIVVRCWRHRRRDTEGGGDKIMDPSFPASKKVKGFLFDCTQKYQK